MGFFSKFFGKGGSANTTAPAPACAPLTVYAPADGEVIPISEFPDELFSDEMLGPGCGILPSGDLIAAPFNGTVTQVADTLHTVHLTSDDGMKVLIHVGVDTVAMKGKGFKAHVKTDQKVHRGDQLIHFDREAIKKAEHPDAIAVILTNAEEFAGIELKRLGKAAIGDELFQAKSNV